jgi:hypothetical protein
MDYERRGGTARGSPLGAKARDEWREVRMSDERAGFLSARREESEKRIEQDFLAGEHAA